MTTSAPRSTRGGLDGRARGTPPSSRRGRTPGTDLARIIDAAHGLLVSDGVDAVTLRAVARTLTMTAPALYRYVDSREQLLAVLGARIRTDAVRAVEASRRGAGDHPVEQMRAACRAFRGWAVGHPVEFGVAFGRPTGSAAGASEADTADDPADGVVDDGEPAGVYFAGAFAGIYAAMWAAAPYDVVPDADLDPAFAARLTRYRSAVGLGGVPLDAVRRFLGAWVHIFGMVAVEVFGHIAFVLEDAEPLFEAELTDLLS